MVWMIPRIDFTMKVQRTSFERGMLLERGGGKGVGERVKKGVFLGGGFFCCVLVGEEV